MAISIGRNMSALRALRQLDGASATLSETFQRLSSGQRINKASDDAAGLAIADDLNVRSRVYAQGIRNVNDGISLANVAEGALGELLSIVTRQRELAEQAANGNYSGKQRLSLNKEAAALTKEYNRIVQSTAFNGELILDGTQDTLQLQHGTGSLSSTTLATSDTMGVAAGDGTFAAPVNYAAAIETEEVKLADLNGDGALDIIASNHGFPCVTVRLNTGGGTFSTAVSLAAAAGTSQIGVGDFNGDGYADLIVGIRGASTYMNYYQGNGNGTFKLGVTIAAGISGTFEQIPGNVAVNDYNNDGKLDAVFSTAGGATYFMAGNGNGTFSAASSFGAAAIDVTSADLNEDGNADIIYAASNSLLIRYGNGNGTFQAIQTINTTQPSAISIADLNGDGRLDILSATRQGYTTYLGTSAGGFSANAGLQFRAAGGFNSARTDTADFNGDGVLDFVLTNVDENDTFIFIGNGNGTFAAPTSIVGSGPIGNAEAADINADGVVDLVIGVKSGAAAVFLGNADSTGRRNNLQSALDLTTASGARSALTLTSTQLDRLTSQLGSLGAVQSRLESVTNTLRSSQENAIAARSRIVDADIATESASLTRVTILQQAASSVLAHASLEPNLVLTLLQK